MMKKLLFVLFVAGALAACNTKRSSTSEISTTVVPDTIQTVLHVERMTCDHCEMTIEGSVKELPGIVQVKAEHLDSTTLIKYDASQISIETIAQAIEKKGYKVVGEK